jgi:CcmD family protein
MNAVLDAGVAIYVALAVALSVWIGIFVYIWRLDGQARELRRRLDSIPDRAPAPTPAASLRSQQPTAVPEEQPLVK